MDTTPGPKEVAARVNYAHDGDLVWEDFVDEAVPS